MPARRSLGDELRAQYISCNTSIFGQNHEYIYQLGNIYAAKAIIDSVLSEIIPNVQNYKNLSKFVEQLMNALDDLKYATKKCVTEMEE